MHQWDIKAAQDEDTFFEDHIEAIVTADVEPLPPGEQQIGEVIAHWDRVGNGAFIQAHGGTVDDRIFARALIAAQLSSHGIREAEMSLDDPIQDLYHLTPTSERASVQTHGLWPSKPALRTDSFNPDPAKGAHDVGVYGYPELNGEWREYMETAYPELGEFDWWRIPREQIEEAYPDRKNNGAWYVPHRVFPELVQGPEHRMQWPPKVHGEGEDQWVAQQPEFGRHWDPRLGSQHIADWNDIMDKARRLIQDGKVRILRNGYTNIVAHVKGDHGEYDPEIFRQDPNSRSITMSDCGCNWGEFQNQPRTRNWKRFQDRPCSHVLAAYWLAQSTPLDEDAVPTGQGPSPAGPATQMGVTPQQAPQGPPPAPQGQGMGAPGIAPQQPMQGPEGPSPADVLPQFQTEPPDVQPQNPASVPGLRGPSPTNPINYPPGPGGTFSSWQKASDYAQYQQRFQPWEPGSWGKGFVSPMGRVFHWQTPSVDGDPIHWEGMTTHGWGGALTRGEAPTGFFGDDTYRQLHPFIVSPEGGVSPHYPEKMPSDVWDRLMKAHPAFSPDTGYARSMYDGDEESDLWDTNQSGSGTMYSNVWDAGLKPDPSTNPHGSVLKGTQRPVWSLPDMWHVASDGDEIMPSVDERDPRWTAPLANGQLVQLMTNYDTGVQQGRSEAHGAGTEMPLPQGLVGEVLGNEGPVVHVLWMGKPWDQNSYFEPYGAIGQHLRGSLLHRPDLRPPGPALRRRR